MKTFFKWFVIITLIAIAVWWFGWGSTHQVKTSPVEQRSVVSIQITKAKLSDASSFNEFAGTVQSSVTVQLSARIVAHIQEITVHAGTFVKKGDILIRLDDGEIKARIKQAQSVLAAAEATRDEAKRDLERYQDLVRRGTESKQKLDQVETKYQNTISAVETAKQQIAEIQESLGYTEIKATFDAVVVEKFAEQGDLASPGKVLITLQDPNRLRLEAPISEQCARRIRLNDTALAKVSSVDAEFSAKVSEIVPAVDPKSRSFLVRANLPANQTNIKPGMFARLKFPCAPRKILTVSKKTVLNRGQLDFVFVVESNEAKLRMIRLGEEFQDQVEVLSGLRENEIIIANPSENLRDGDPVAITEK